MHTPHLLHMSQHIGPGREHILAFFRVQFLYEIRREVLVGILIPVKSIEIHHVSVCFLNVSHIVN